MADPRRTREAHDALLASHAAARHLSEVVGPERARRLLERSASELERRLESVHPSLGADTFTVTQLRASLEHVRAVLRLTTLPDLSEAVLGATEEAAAEGARRTMAYLAAADRAFRGTAAPLAIRPASMMDAAMMGNRSSVLTRLVHGVERRRDPRTRRRKNVRTGILARYGMETVGHFEEELRAGMVAGTPWIEMRERITRHSPFLQGAPKHWAHRIVRTEVMSSYNAASHRTIKKASETLGGMLKILSATFDDRTGADSYAVHGQVRRPDEDFESWFGDYEHPPNRPNDREVVVPHRQRWELPEYLEPRSDDEVEDAWEQERRKGPPPERPLMSTVDGFGDV